MASEQRFYSRRQALSLGRKALFFLGVASLFPISRYLTAIEKPSSEIRVEISKFPLDAQWKQVGQSRFWLCQRDSEVEAIWASCTHLGCEVNYVAETEQWHCPCHGSDYTRDGQPIKGPAQTSLARAKVRLRDGFYILRQPQG